MQCIDYGLWKHESWLAATLIHTVDILFQIAMEMFLYNTEFLMLYNRSSLPYLIKLNLGFVSHITWIGHGVKILWHIVSTVNVLFWIHNFHIIVGTWSRIISIYCTTIVINILCVHVCMWVGSAVLWCLSDVHHN